MANLKIGCIPQSGFMNCFNPLLQHWTGFGQKLSYAGAFYSWYDHKQGLEERKRITLSPSTILLDSSFL